MSNQSNGYTHIHVVPFHNDQLDYIDFILRISNHMGRWALLFFMGRLTAIAEDTLTEFLAKATGTAVEWIQTIELIFLLLNE